jgi:hypothetical protein
LPEENGRTKIGRREIREELPTGRRLVNFASSKLLVWPFYLIGTNLGSGRFVMLLLTTKLPEENGRTKIGRREIREELPTGRRERVDPYPLLNTILREPQTR